VNLRKEAAFSAVSRSLFDYGKVRREFPVVLLHGNNLQLTLLKIAGHLNPACFNIVQKNSGRE